MIAFIGAMEIEIQEILERMNNVKLEKRSGIDFYQGEFANKKCIVMKSGIGKTAAAMSTTILMENFDVDGVVNIGTAGGLQKEQNVLDVVVSVQVTHHDIDVPGWEKGFDLDERCYFSNPSFLEMMRNVVGTENKQVWFGNMITGDCFIYRDKQIEEINEHYPTALCAEMEGASIAQVCDHYKKPFIIIRSLSDIVHHEESSMMFEEYAQKASKRSALWCEKFIEQYKNESQ